MAAPSLHYPDEEFTVRLRERIPMNVCFTFTSEQLDALRRAFGDRLDGEHAIDKRGRLHLPWSQYYLVLQAGRDRRRNLRRNVVPQPRQVAIDSLLLGVCIAGLIAAGAWLALNLL